MKKNKCLLRFVHRSVILTAATLVLSSSLRCSTQTVSGTSGSETGNGRVSGCIVDTVGKSRSGVQVILLPSTYDPLKGGDSLQLDTTDTSGKYLFTCNPGSYTLQSVHLSEGTKSYSDSVIVDTNEVVLAPDTLKVPGVITIALPENGTMEDGYFYIPGTTIYSLPEGNRNTVIMHSVPAACITSVCYTETGNDEVRVIRNNVPVTPGDSIFIHHPEWKYARPVYINTSSSGVRITEDVTDFPIVVRLSKPIFAFEQFAEDGSDLLFTNPDGLPLPFEIEHWDPIGGSAEVWVRVDTIRADSDSQYIMILWGRPSPGPNSGESMVFDTANGYQGVWHLNEDPVSGTDSVGDVTVNHRHGTWKGTQFSTVQGAIGPALGFGSPTGAGESCIELPNETQLDYHGAITISCWVRLTESSPDSFNIAGKYSFGEEPSGAYIFNGYALFCSSRRTIQLRIGFGESSFFYVESDGSIADTGWHHIAATFQPGRITLFVDAAGQEYTLPETPVPSSGKGFIGGRQFFDGTEPFTGEIDEVRISNTVRTTDWIRLCYMNQKQNSALLVWK